MKPSKIFNRLLANFDITLIHCSRLDQLSAGIVQPISAPAKDSLVATRAISRAGVASIESKIDELRQELLRQQISTKWELIDCLERFMSDDKNTETCPLCNHEGSKKTFPVLVSHCIFGGGRLTRFQCPECDVIYGGKKMLAMNAAELTQDYESHYKVFQEGDSTEQEIRAFHLLNPSKDGVYLNYGSGGWSKSVQVLRSQGWNVFAFEPHDSACSSLDYLIKSKEDLLKMKFDGVFSNNVLEHLRHPAEELSSIKKIVKSGGRMAHATPCFEYLYEYTRFHLFFYLGRSRTFLAEKAGLVVSDFVVDGEFMCTLYESKTS